MFNEDHSFMSTLFVTLCVEQIKLQVCFMYYVRASDCSGQCRQNVKLHIVIKTNFDQQVHECCV